MSTEAWSDAWADALSALELDVDEAEAMLAIDHVFQATARDPWTPPVNLGPMPAHLVDRARTLLARQLDVSKRLTEAARSSRKHMAAVNKIVVALPSPPVYLDTPA